MKDEEHNLAHAIATKIFKWELITRSHPKFADSVGTGYYDGESYICSTYSLPCWASNIRDAWSLIHELELLGWDFTISTRHEGRKGSFVEVHYLKSSIFSFHEYVQAEAEEGKMPLAICRAIIKAADAIEIYLLTKE